MKFGKQIQAQQVPGWSAYYLDYKALKKIISALVNNRAISKAITTSPTPNEHLSEGVLSKQSSLQNQVSPGQPPLFSASEHHGEERGPVFQAQRAAFFFRLERELEKINTFYLQKEAELKLRLETLLSKRRAAAMRILPTNQDDSAQNHVEWIAVEEGFKFLEKDLSKLEQFIEINATGFRKILKKWDKRSKSTTKELYLARQVDVQPVFNRQFISELSDTVAACLLNLTDLSTGVQFEDPSVVNLAGDKSPIDPKVSPHLGGPFRDLETNFRTALAESDESAIQDLIRFAGVLAQDESRKPTVTRILWKIIIDASEHFADMIIDSTSFDFSYVDDINGRTCLHEAAIAGAPRLVGICLRKDVQPDKADVYGRSALHYAAMQGNGDICRRLLEAHVPPDTLDVDSCSPLAYATMRGTVECLQVLLEQRSVSDQLISSTGNNAPLLLASHSGRVEVVLLLLKYGAKSVPNTNGEYPMHLAAKEGHANVCRTLLGYEGWDVKDKYHEWTPLFHAARHGRIECLDILLDAGARTSTSDEFGYQAVHYAAWYGHHNCVNRLVPRALLSAMSDIERVEQTSPQSGKTEPLENEIDAIPSLSLPPPIMPHRVYGHNYLDKSFLVQVSVGAWSSSGSPPNTGVVLHHRLISDIAKDGSAFLSTSPSTPLPLKLVMTSPSSSSTPYTISLPQTSDQETFAFPVASLEGLSLEFSLYPSFGTKTIGRAVALPAWFRNMSRSGIFVLPILDRKLQLIGEVTFRLNIITPFEGVTLEIGGGVETYWKSSTGVPLPVPSILQTLTRPSTSTFTSPSIQSIMASDVHNSTTSSLIGNYLHLNVQVTKDSQPVVYDGSLLPVSEFQLNAEDVSLAEFEALASRLRREPRTEDLPSDSLVQVARNWMGSLVAVLKNLPSSIPVSLDISYPAQSAGKAHAPRIGDINSYVDAVLRTIYDTVSSGGNNRKVTFTSFHPDVCAALNWKQPNYPVFFSSQCGINQDSAAMETDKRLSSLGKAIEFARVNNLLGVLLYPELVMSVPSLIQAIKDTGLIVGIYDFAPIPLTRPPGLDAIVRDGIAMYYDQTYQLL